MLKIAIITGSTRPGRKSEAVARWVYDIAAKRSDASFEIVDIAAFNLPLLDEAASSRDEPVRKAAYEGLGRKISTFDAFVFVMPEYNHSTSGALKNAIDFLFREWNDKAAGFVGYGGVGGARAVEHLRLVMGEVKVADVRAQVALSMFTDFENFSTLKPGPHQEAAVNAMLDDLIAWGQALQIMRTRSTRTAHKDRKYRHEYACSEDLQDDNGSARSPRRLPYARTFAWTHHATGEPVRPRSGHEALRVPGLLRH